MTHKEFVEYTKEKGAELEKSAKALLIIEEYGIDSVIFAEAYEGLLKAKLEYYRVITEYYQQMYDNSFWFMKPLVAKKLRMFGAFHSHTLSKLVIATMYRKYQSIQIGK